MCLVAPTAEHMYHCLEPVHGHSLLPMMFSMGLGEPAKNAPQFRARSTVRHNRGEWVGKYENKFICILRRKFISRCTSRTTCPDGVFLLMEGFMQLHISQ